ncbi:uncharacterized protein LOC128269793 [Anopheles cruzii]|uniref:uncharacterized protein LOC128269793 n=1 Tax=Anopheles cruzii TaxID=68878 RepID=UPI0022EC6883|nr:uncharacterized protein LOC128269793 [Anopheles cruzii]
MGSSVSSLMKRYSIGSSASATQLVLGPEAPPPKPGSDRYCWKCKKPNFLLSLSPKSGMVSCSTCPRSFHAKLLFNPFDKSACSGYDEKVSHHVDLCVLRERNDKQQYASTEAFLSDLSWIQHNMQIVEAEDPNLIQCAKQIYKKAKKQMSEIDLCYECYINIQFNEKWFELACSKPHLLVWAKLKGYPYWPAKVFANASLLNQVLVLFFGAHDRATIAPKDCFLFSEQDPNNKPAKRPTWDTSMNEARAHISRLIERFGTFRYAQNHTQLDVRRVDEYTKNMIPGAFASLHSTVERIGAIDAPIARPPAGSGDGSEPHSGTDCAAKTKLTMKILKNSGKVVAISSLTTPEASGPATNIEFPTGGGTSTTGEKLSDDTAGGGASGSLHSQPAPPEVPSIKRITRRMSRKSVSAKEYDSAVEDQSVRGTGSFAELRKKRKSVGMMDTEKRLEQQQHQQQQSQPRESDKVESLLIRRNSATWETEPISKRRKSTAKNRGRPKTPSASGANHAEGGRETSEHEAASQETRLMTTGKEPECVSIPIRKLLLRRKSVAHCLRPSPDTESLPVEAAPSLPVDNGSTMPSAVDEPPLQGPSTVTPPQPGTSDLASLLTVETDESLNVTAETALLDPNMIIPAEIKQEPVSESEDNLSTTEELSSVQLAATVAEPRNTRQSISTDTSNGAQQCAVDQGLASGKDDTPVPQSRNKSKETDAESSFQQSVVGQRARKTFPAGNKNAPKHVGSSATSTGGSTDPKQTPVPHMVNIPNPLPTSLGNGFKPEFTITGSRAAMAESGIVGPAVSILMVSNTGGNSSNGCAVTPVPTPTTSAVPTSTPVPPATGALSSPIATTKIEKQYGASSECLPSSATDVHGEADVESLATLRPPPLQAKPTGAPIPGNTGEAVSQSRSPPMVSDLVVQASGRMADYCQRLLEEMLTKFTSQGSLEAKLAQLHLELENAEKRHQLERARLTQEHAKKLADERLKLEQEKDAAIREVRQIAATEKDRAVALAKKTQWCKRCPKEAMYYCCWNTSYCDPNCQQSDWSSHQKVCTQVQNRAERPLVAGGGSTVGSGSPDNLGAASADVIVLDDSPVRAGSAGRKRPSARISPSSGAKARLIPRCSLNGTITFTKAMQISDVVGNATEMHGERRHVSSGVVLPSSSAGPVNATAVRITMPANRPTPPVIAPRRSTSQQTAERPKSNSSTTQNNPYMRERLFNNNSIASLDSGPSRLTAYTVLSANHTGATTGAGPRVWNQFYLPSTSDYT